MRGLLGACTLTCYRTGTAKAHWATCATSKQAAPQAQQPEITTLRRVAQQQLMSDAVQAAWLLPLPTQPKTPPKPPTLDNLHINQPDRLQTPGAQLHNAQSCAQPGCLLCCTASAAVQQQ
jgi:hypothetical protein